MKDGKSLCPCCSGKAYNECCKLFHDGVPVKNALTLMRSRYCAYALNKADNIIATTHPANPGYEENKTTWKLSISKFSKKYSFDGLEILDFQEKEGEGVVTFCAHLSYNNADASFKEKSYFEKKEGKWLYLYGERV